MKVQFPDPGAATAVEDLQAGYEATTQAVWGLLWQYEHRGKYDEPLARWLGANGVDLLRRT
jgi:hypothetical protein